MKANFVFLSGSHRGIVLSYSAKKKTDMCNDLFPPPTQTKTSESPSSRESITDLTQRGEQQYFPYKARIVTIGESPANEEGLFFKCIGHRLLPNGIKESGIFSTAFLPGFMYVAFETSAKADTEYTIGIQGYVSMSAEYVELSQVELETRYLSARRRLSKF